MGGDFITADLMQKLKKLILFVVVFAVSFIVIQFGYNFYIGYREDYLAKEARKLYDEAKSLQLPMLPMPEFPPEKPEPFETEKTIQPEFEVLRKTYDNDDIIGYLKIENTSVDYPVLQYTDNDYYLNRGIDKNLNMAGSLYLDYENNVAKEDKNSIIYGHNMRQDIMFHSLRYFTNEDYYKERKNITFNTIYDNYKWEVFAFYSVDVRDFYYLDVNFKSDEDFLALVNKMKSLSLYDTGIEVTAEDRILTLSTCTNITETSRYVLNAKLVEVNGIPYAEYLQKRKSYENELKEYEEYITSQEEKK